MSDFLCHIQESIYSYVNNKAYYCIAVECKSEFLVIQLLTLIDQLSMTRELFHLVELEQNLNITADIYTEDRHDKQKHTCYSVYEKTKQFDSNRCD